jgi:hypothetical protein
MIHPSSFMERDSHPEAIYELLEIKVDRALIGTRSASFLLGFSSLTHVLSIATIVEEAAETVKYALGLPTTSRGRSSSHNSKNKEFTTFVERVLDTAEVSITDILVTLVYMRRARAHLSIETEEWALHRVFLGALVLAHKVCRNGFIVSFLGSQNAYSGFFQHSNDSTLRNVSWSYATDIFGARDIGRMEREFLDVLDYELSVTEAELLDLHETLVSSQSSQQSTQLHPYFHTSALERAPRPQGGVQMFRTRRIVDDEEDEEEQEDGSVSSGYFYYEDEVPTTPILDEVNESDEQTKVGAKSSVPSSPETPTSSESPLEHSTAATSVFSYNPHVVSKPISGEDDDAQRSVIARALWLAGHQLISTLPTAFPQIAVSA